jgi:hypothetical protein
MRTHDLAEQGGTGGVFVAQEAVVVATSRLGVVVARIGAVMDEVSGWPWSRALSSTVELRDVAALLSR